MGVEQEIAQQRQAEGAAFDDAFNEFAGQAPAAPQEAAAPEDDAAPEAPPEDSGEGGEDAEKDAAPPSEETPEQRAERLQRDAEYWKHRYESDVGRITAYQRQVQELQQQIAQGRHQGADQPTQAEVKDAMASPEAWQDFREEYPDIADAIDARLRSVEHAVDGRVREHVEPLRQTLQPLQEQAYTQHRSQQLAALEAAHPDWRTTAQSADFQQWLQTQPQPVQQLYGSDDARDASYLLDAFKAMTGAGTPVPEEARANRNRQRLEQAAGIRRRGGSGPSSAVPDDFEGAFQAFVQQHHRGR